VSPISSASFNLPLSTMHHPMPLHAPVTLSGLLLCLATAGAWGQAPASTAAPCAPLISEAANASEQRPEFPAQTRACAAPRSAPFKLTVLTTGLVNPWAVEPLPDGSLLVTEKPGRLRIVSPTGQLGPTIAGLPKVDARGQGGLLDVALSPDFVNNRTIYWSFTEARTGGNGTSVARGVLSADRTQLEQVKVIVRTLPTYDGDKHFGSRLAFGPDGMLYVTLGERSDMITRPQAQQMGSHLGKVLRVRPDGSAPAGNPFVGQPGALPEIWSLGHRNVQASAFDPQGRLWVVEMGTQGGDELNLVDKGKNYGWPLIAYGEEYNGRPIGDGTTRRDGLQQPLYYWDPVIAPSGAQWYTGTAFPAWRGNLFVGALKEKSLVRLVMDGQRVVGEERLLTDRGQRVRDVRQGPDGALYVVTDERKGELWKLTP
jgi:aldose sugar dehydrogenase